MSKVLETTDVVETTEVGESMRAFAPAGQLMSAMWGRGKELSDLLRKELKVPEGVTSFEVKFACDDVIKVRCEYTPRGPIA